MKLILSRYIFILAVATLAFVGNIQADQPHMENALANLRAARQQLENARPDKAGHRAKAIAALDRAIEETRLGIEAGRH